jgi:hypothetical protein
MAVSANDLAFSDLAEQCFFTHAMANHDRHFSDLGATNVVEVHGTGVVSFTAIGTWSILGLIYDGNQGRPMPRVPTPCLLDVVAFVRLVVPARVLTVTCLTRTIASVRSRRFNPEVPLKILGELAFTADFLRASHPY